MIDPILCPHRQIRITVPRATMRKLFEQRSPLTPAEANKMRAYKAKIEQTLYAIQNLDSIVEKILLKSL